MKVTHYKGERRLVFSYEEAVHFITEQGSEDCGILIRLQTQEVLKHPKGYIYDKMLTFIPVYDYLEIPEEEEL